MYYIRPRNATLTYLLRYLPAFMLARERDCDPVNCGLDRYIVHYTVRKYSAYRPTIITIITVITVSRLGTSNNGCTYNLLRYMSSC